MHKSNFVQQQQRQQLAEATQRRNYFFFHYITCIKALVTETQDNKVEGNFIGL